MLLKDIFMLICQQRNTLGFISFSLYVWVRYSKFSHCLFPIATRLLTVVNVHTNVCAIALNQCVYSSCSGESVSLTNTFPGHCNSNASGTLTAHKAHRYVLQCIDGRGVFLFQFSSLSSLVAVYENKTMWKIKSTFKLWKSCCVLYLTVRRRCESSEGSFIMGRWVSSSHAGMVDPICLAACSTQAFCLVPRCHRTTRVPLLFSRPAMAFISAYFNTGESIWGAEWGFIIDTKVEARLLLLVCQQGALMWGV